MTAPFSPGAPPYGQPPGYPPQGYPPQGYPPQGQPPGPPPPGPTPPGAPGGPPRPRGSAAGRAATAIAIVVGGFGLLGGAVFLAITFFGGEGAARGSASTAPRQPRPGFVPAPLPTTEDRDATAAIRFGTCRRNDVERGRGSYLTAMRGRGAASALRGRVALVHFKLTMPSAAWTPQTSRAVTVSALASRAWLLEQAARARVPGLTIDAIEWPLATSFVMPNIRLDARKRVTEEDGENFRKATRAAIERAVGMSFSGVVEELQALGYANAGFLVHFPTGPHGIRDFAAPSGAKGDAAELAYVLEPEWNHASRSLLATHELLHLFGADDLYDIRGATSDETNDVMNAECTGLAPTFIGAATAYGIGWSDAPPARPYTFP